MNEILSYLTKMWQQICQNPLPSLAIVGNLILIESLLSVDNAAVLATMVMDLPEDERKKALKYGIFGAYIFRGLAMIFATILIQIWWLKPLGGIYLIYLVFDWWKTKRNPQKEDETIDKKSNWFYRVTVGSLGSFWATVILVEMMDLAFSIDNVFAAVAFTNNIILVCVGVFIGILAMRFVAQYFVKLMEKYWFLENAAFIVIGVLGIKLILSIYEHYYPDSIVTKFMLSSKADIAVSILTVSIFFIPLITSAIFNFPKKHTRL